MRSNRTCNIDKYVRMVGAQAVLNPFTRMMQNNFYDITDLCLELRKALIKREYTRIRNSITDNDGKPIFSIKKAEAIYLMCCSLDDPVEPHDDDELDLLRYVPKCSPLKSLWRLREVHAIKSFDNSI